MSSYLILAVNLIFPLRPYEIDYKYVINTLYMCKFNNLARSKARNSDFPLSIFLMHTKDRRLTVYYDT